MLFRRSQAFRTRVVASIDMVLAATTGCRKDKPLPEPKEAANELKRSALAIFDAWGRDFGAAHRTLAIAVRYAQSRIGSRDYAIPAPQSAHARQVAALGGNGRAQEVGSEAIDNRREDEVDRTLRERQVGSILRDAPAFVREVEGCVMGVGNRLRSEIAAQKHSMFSEVLEQPSSRAPRDFALSMEGAAELASLGVFGNGYNVNIAIGSEPLLGGADEEKRIELREIYTKLKQQQVPQLKTWLHALTAIRASRALSSGEEALLEKIENLIGSTQDAVRRCREAGVLHEKKKDTDRDRGDAAAEDSDEMEDVQLPPVRALLAQEEEGGEDAEDWDRYSEEVGGKRQRFF